MPPTPLTAPLTSGRRLRHGALFLLDAFSWFALPSVFLLIYVTYFSFPKDAVAAHYYVFFLGWAGLVSLRVATYSFLTRKVAVVFSSALLTTAAFTAVLFYMLVFLGLSFWGNVPTTDLVAPYIRDRDAFVETLGMSGPVVLGAIALVLLCFLVIFYWYSTRVDWVPRLVDSRLHRILPIAAISLALGVSIKMHEFWIQPLGAQAEPLSLVFFPKTGQVSFQTHPVANFSSPAARQEQNARETFAPSAPILTRNVVVIVVDALRPDRMSAYGYHRATTPTLDRQLQIARSQIVEDTYATCAESLCGIYGILNSRFPNQMVARPFGLSEVLRRHGYKVTFILSGDHTHFYGLKEVYGPADYFYDASHTDEYYINDDRLVVDQVRQLPEWDGTAQMFHFHLMSSHGLGRRLEEHRQWLPEANYVMRGNREQSRVDNFYDNGVRQTDYVIGEILRSLEEKGYLDDALVVVTGDHGEALGEHGLFSHSNTVHEPILRIPLIFVSYGGGGALPLSSDVIASQVDIAPTILSGLGISPPTIWEGQSLQHGPGSRTIRFQQGPEIGVIEASPKGDLWKYWRNAQTGQEYVFELRSDPGEVHNLVQEAPTELVLDWRRRVLGSGASAPLRATSTKSH
jgi:glucan phosphoethanolaminetransferase (alkaline phosphatase superfamily)